mgnify:CR=1 FL=1
MRESECYPIYPSVLWFSTQTSPGTSCVSLRTSRCTSRRWPCLSVTATACRPQMSPGTRTTVSCERGRGTLSSTPRGCWRSAPSSSPTSGRITVRWRMRSELAAVSWRDWNRTETQVRGQVIPGQGHSLLWNHSFSWGPMFRDFDGLWGRNFVDNWFVALQHVCGTNISGWG